LHIVSLGKESLVRSDATGVLHWKKRLMTR
jgi:hypothetical protein